MPNAARPRIRRRAARREPRLSDEELLDRLQRQTFRYFWEGADRASGLALDRCVRRGTSNESPVAIGGSGFGAMAILVAAERGWVRREQALERFALMLDCLEKATCYHGMYPHFVRGDTGATVPFIRKDDGADLVETALLFQGLLCVRAYFDRDAAEEVRLRSRITRLWHEAEWSWHTQGGRKVLTWHWSPTNGFALNHEIHGWNECLIAYVLAAAAPRYGVGAELYHEGWAMGRVFLNRRAYEGVELPLGMDWGGPLFFAHYSFCGLDPRGLRDAYADYWQQNVNHTRINYAYCQRNPHRYKGYGADCWGLTAGEGFAGYAAHAPDNDRGVITPAAALSSFAYAPQEAMAALRHFYEDLGERIWGPFGFVDGFSEQQDWYADVFLAVNQGPIVVMIENYRSGLLWRLFMGIAEIQSGLRKLGFRSPHLGRGGE
jgi:hypothetical protein